MEWLHSYKQIRSHPKTLKLARRVGGLPVAVGCLHCLWWWSIDYAPDGDLSDRDAEDIAVACAWDGDPQAIVDALVASGFLDQDSGGLRIHDFDEYIGRYQSKADADARAKREEYAARKNGARDAQATRKRRASETHATRTRTLAREEERREEKKREDQEHTVREEEHFSHSSDAESAPDTLSPSEPVDNVEECTEVEVIDDDVPSHDVDDRLNDDFEDFWRTYPRRDGSKKRAATCWRRLPKYKREQALGIAQLMGELNRRGIGPPSKYIPQATTFLNGEMWDGWRDGVPPDWDNGNGEAVRANALREEHLRRFAAERGLEYEPA